MLLFGFTFGVEAIHRSAKEGRVQRVLISIPKAFGGAAGIAESMYVEKAELLCGLHLLGENTRCIRIVDIIALPESSHL